MINSKAKGAVGEREAVRLCRSEGFDCHRTAQYCGNVPEGSADIVGLPLIHVEVKRNEHLNIDDALSQSTRDLLLPASVFSPAFLPVFCGRRAGV